MATAPAIRITNLQNRVSGQLELIHCQMEERRRGVPGDMEERRRGVPGGREQIEKPEAALAVQFRRIADMKAELDQVKATVRRRADLCCATDRSSTHPSPDAATSRFASALSAWRRRALSRDVGDDKRIQRRVFVSSRPLDGSDRPRSE